MRSCTIGILLLALAAPLLAETTFSIHPVSNCGRPPYSGGPTFFLEAGPQEIRWESGAYSVWSYEGANGGYEWLANVHAYVHATGEDLAWGTGIWYASQAEASADASGQVFVFDIAVASLVTFFVSDEPCGDNRGGYTLSLLDRQTADTRELPLAFALRAPVPNPFNPSTTLGFTLPETGAVQLAVYDIQGRLVSQLLDGMLSRGEHEAVFEAGNQPSGLYIARLLTEQGHSTRKMLLVK